MRIISQAIGFIALIFTMIAYHKQDKKKILSYTIIANVINLIHYILLNGYSAGITKVIAISRDLFIIKKEKNKTLSNKFFLYIFIMIYIVLGYFTYTGAMSLLPILAAEIYAITIWNGNEIVVRYSALGTTFLWLIYNIYIFSISGIISNIFLIISTILAIKKR